MTLRAPARRPVPHVVGFHDGDAALVPAVRAYLADGLEAGGSAVVFATPGRRRAITDALEHAGLPVEALRASGRYAAHDAHGTLSAFMRDGAPDPDAVAGTVGSVLRAAAEGGGPVRVFGEMVAVLWQAGNVAAAIELETQWNRLIDAHGFELLCGYPMGAVDETGDLAAAKAVCDRHTDVRVLRGARPFAGPPPSRSGTSGAGRLFAPTPQVLGEVRAYVRAALRGRADAQLLGVAELVVCELATNAVVHARSPFRVSVVPLPGEPPAVRIAVEDTSAATPRVVLRGDGDPGGRGVRVVAALSRAWGTRATGGGKTVWAELAAS